MNPEVKEMVIWFSNVSRCDGRGTVEHKGSGEFVVLLGRDED